jgi:L-ascorbate metabolism protein UlaG (beta-lactamase superfamily)
MKIRIVLILSIILIITYALFFSENGGELSMRNESDHHTSKGFQNYPYVETDAPKGAFFYLRRVWSSIFLPDVPGNHVVSEAEAIRHFNSLDNNKIIWLGHASFIIEISGKTILTDPFLSEYASPVSWAGPRRFVPPGISIENLPSINIIIVSHNHFDHLDDKTIRGIKEKEKIHIIVPLGLKDFFLERGYTMISELDWKESISFDDLEITALPSVHNSGRSTDDKNQTLWAAWTINSMAGNILFVGDTGYSETIFKNISHQWGQFDYAILPIGAYEPREVMWMSHITPEEAVTIGKEVMANILIASHWGTINLSDEPPFEPPQRFKEAGEKNGFLEESLWIMKIGETRELIKVKI